MITLLRVPTALPFMPRESAWGVRGFLNLRNQSFLLRLVRAISVSCQNPASEFHGLIQHVKKRADAFGLKDEAAPIAVRLHAIIYAGVGQDLLQRQGVLE